MATSQMQNELDRTAKRLLAEPLDQLLSQYKKLRRKEQTLGEIVKFLEKQVAEQGHLTLPFWMKLKLDQERKKLADVQLQLKPLEHEIKKSLKVPVAKRTQVDANRLGQLIDEFKAKRELESIYQDNLNYLEELQAKLSLEPRIDLHNELKLTKVELIKVRIQLDTLKQQIKDEWQLELERITHLEAMSNEEIWDYAYKVITEMHQPHSVKHPSLIKQRWVPKSEQKESDSQSTATQTQNSRKMHH